MSNQLNEIESLSKTYTNLKETKGLNIMKNINEKEKGLNCVKI